MKNKCTEKTSRWPDALADVSPDEVELFLAHADACPFHTEKLQAEEERVQAIFRLARGVDGQGRVLQGAALKNAIKEHERRQQLWKDAAGRMKPPFKRIYLSNCGDVIASSGKFYDFRRYEGDHALHLQSGLQIWGVLDEEGKTEEVLLGFYPLVGVRHTGKEKLLPLNNGFTVGLKVELLADGHFKINFRCVEKEMLDKKWDEMLDRKEKSEKAAAAKTFKAKNSFFSRLDRGAAQHPSPSPFTRPSFGYRSAVSIFTSFLFLAGAFTQIIGHNRGDSSKKSVSTVNLDRSTIAQGGEDPLLSATNRTSAIQETKEQVERGQQQSARDKAQPSIGNRWAEGKLRRTGSTRLREPPLTKTEVFRAGIENSQSALLSVPGIDGRAENLDAKSHRSWYFQSFVHSGANADQRLVVHTGSDMILGNRLLAEINQRAIEAVPLNSMVANMPLPQQFTAIWGIDRQEKSVTVEITLTVGRESRFLSFRSEGISEEQAYEKAVKDAVSGVFAIIDQNDGGQEKVVAAGR